MVARPGNTLKGNGLPDGMLGRIGVSVSGADPRSGVRADRGSRKAAFTDRTTAADHWTRVNDDGRFRQRAWYFSKVYADPKSADTVYVLNTGLYRSG